MLKTIFLTCLGHEIFYTKHKKSLMPQAPILTSITDKTDYKLIQEGVRLYPNFLPHRTVPKRTVPL
jgi:hypothetical protein